MSYPDGSSVSAERSWLLQGVSPTQRRLVLRRAGVTLDQRGFIGVDDHLRAISMVSGAEATAQVHSCSPHASWNDYRISVNKWTGSPWTIRGLQRPDASSPGRSLLNRSLDVSRNERAESKGTGTECPCLRSILRQFHEQKTMRDTTGR